MHLPVVSYLSAIKLPFSMSRQKYILVLSGEAFRSAVRLKFLMFSSVWQRLFIDFYTLLKPEGTLERSILHSGN